MKSFVFSHFIHKLAPCEMEMQIIAFSFPHYTSRSRSLRAHKRKASTSRHCHCSSHNLKKEAKHTPPRVVSHVIPRRSILQLAQNAALSILLTNFSVPYPTQAVTRGLPKGVAEAVVKNVTWPSSWPYNSTDFVRFDSRSDDEFYAFPRLVRHIDDGAVSALKIYYSKLLPDVHDVLDICSSIESYLPTSWEGRGNIAGLGMNEVELARNPSLTEYVVADLNVDVRLPYKDDSFDLVTCNVSIDYLIKPREVLREVARVLRTGGRVVFSFSNRIFATKAVAVWVGGGDEEHIYTVASFLHYAGGFSEPVVADLSPRKNDVCTGDPLYIVSAIREA